MKAIVYVAIHNILLQLTFKIISASSGHEQAESSTGGVNGEATSEMIGRYLKESNNQYF